MNSHLSFTTVIRTRKVEQRENKQRKSEQTSQSMRAEPTKLGIIEEKLTTKRKKDRGKELYSSNLGSEKNKIRRRSTLPSTINSVQKEEHDETKKPMRNTIRVRRRMASRAVRDCFQCIAVFRHDDPDL